MAATHKRLAERFPGAAEARLPRDVARVVRDVAALLGGKRVDLTSVALDMEGLPPFHRRAYEAARRIPPGATHSYGEVAARLGSPNSSRAVGQAMRRNPFPIVVPCHRVLAAGGRAGGFTAAGGVDTKMRMLEIEGAVLPGPLKNGRVATGKNGRDADAKNGNTAGDTGRGAAAKKRSAAGKNSRAAGLDTRKALRELRAADPVLAALIDEIGPPRIEVKTTRSIFSALSSAIVYQQLTGKAAATIHGRVCALFHDTRDSFTPEHILSAPDEDLRGAGLSRAKVAALRDLAEKTAGGELPTLAALRRMEDEAIVESLTSVRGIGRWTVEMMLMFRLGRTDVLPVDDYGVRKGFAFTYRRRELPTAKELARHGEKWRPWRSVASWYMWRAADRKKA